MKVNRLSNPNRLVVTYDRIPEFFNSGSNTLQVILFEDGRIQFGYRGMTANDAVVGLSPGNNPPWQSADFSSLLGGQSFPAGTAIVQQFPGTPVSEFFDLDGGFLIFEPNAGGGYDSLFIPPQNEGSVGSGVVTGVATNADGSPCEGQVEVRFSCDQSYLRRLSLDGQGRYTVANVPFGGGLRVTLMENPQILGMDHVPINATQATINLAPLQTPNKQPPGGGQP